MQIEINIDPACARPKVVIHTDHMTDEVQSLIKRLSTDAPQVLCGYHNEVLHVLEPSAVLRFYTGGGKVYAQTSDGEYTLRLRLYELEERLDPARFVRISNSEIVNLQKVKAFDMGLSGTICVSLHNGAITYVSRRYLGKIKQVLGV